MVSARVSNEMKKERKIKEEEIINNNKLKLIPIYTNRGNTVT